MQMIRGRVHHRESSGPRGRDALFIVKKPVRCVGEAIQFTPTLHARQRNRPSLPGGEKTGRGVSSVHTSGKGPPAGGRPASPGPHSGCDPGNNRSLPERRIAGHGRGIDIRRAVARAGSCPGGRCPGRRLPIRLASTFAMPGFDTVSVASIRAVPGSLISILFANFTRHSPAGRCNPVPGCPQASGKPLVGTGLGQPGGACQEWTVVPGIRFAGCGSCGCPTNGIVAKVNC